MYVSVLYFTSCVFLLPDDLIHKQKGYTRFRDEFLCFWYGIVAFVARHSIKRKKGKCIKGVSISSANLK